MITTLSRQARRRYPQFGNASPYVVFLPGRGTSVTEDPYTEVVTISGMSLNKDIVIAKLKLEKDIVIANMEL